MARALHLATVGWLAILASLTGLWFVSLLDVYSRSMGELGLLMVLPIAFYLLLAALTISFCLAVRFQPPQAIFLLHLAILILMIHGTPQLLYGTLRYSWAWKHVGLVDHIQQYRSLDPSNVTLGAYHNWPGFFTANAFLTEVAGLESSMDFAGWAPVFFNLINVGALLLIFRACIHDQRLVWLATWFFVLANWVGQDYFSPQATAYFLHLVIIGCMLWWFRQTQRPSREVLRRFLLLHWLADKVDAIFSRVHTTELETQAAPWQRAAIVLIIVLLLATIASSHQLTPFMTIIALTALVVGQRSNARGLPILAILLTFTWLAYGAAIFMQGELADLIASLVDMQETLDSGFIGLGSASYAQQMIAVMGRLLTVSIWGLGLLGAIRRLYNGKWDLSILLLAGAPLVMLAGGSYGGEILFRIYFFTLPFMALLAAALFFPSTSAGRSWLTTTATIIVSFVMLVGLGFAYYGKEQQYYFTPQEVAAVNFLDSIAPPGSLIVEATRNYPVRYRYHTMGTLHVPFTRESEEALKEILADPEVVFLRWMKNEDYPAAYLILTRSMKSEIDMVGAMPPGALDVIQDALADSPYFHVLYSNPDATIFVLDRNYLDSGQMNSQKENLAK